MTLRQGEIMEINQAVLKMLLGSLRPDIADLLTSSAATPPVVGNILYIVSGNVWYSKAVQCFKREIAQAAGALNLSVAYVYPDENPEDLLRYNASTK